MSAFHSDPVRVQVAATSANLGAGFDSFGLALGLFDEIVARVTASGLTIDVSGEGASEVSRDATHLVVRSMNATFDAIGTRPPGLALSCMNEIPHGRGLGSSAAATVGGVIAARALVVDGRRLLPDDAALRLAARIEGHPDNVAACMCGGFTIAWQDDSGARALRLDPAATLVAVVFVPDNPLSTEQARGLLPAVVPHPDAASNAARAALFVPAVTAHPELLMTATQDRLHQDYRAPAMPASAALLRHLRDAGYPAVISGAGPTVLALTTADRAAAVLGLEPSGFTGRQLVLELAGATETRAGNTQKISTWG